MNFNLALYSFISYTRDQTYSFVHCGSSSVNLHPTSLDNMYQNTSIVVVPPTVSPVTTVKVTTVNPNNSTDIDQWHFSSLVKFGPLFEPEIVKQLIVFTLLILVLSIIAYCACKKLLLIWLIKKCCKAKEEDW